MTPEPALGLYVHVPFCSAICNYCNFNRGLYDESLKARFVEALIAEIKGSGAFFRSDFEKKAPDPFISDTLYFGGGTPSLLTPADIALIIDTARVACHLTPDAEITLDYILDEITGCDPQFTEYILSRPANCPACFHEVTEKTLVIPS